MKTVKKIVGGIIDSFVKRKDLGEIESKQSDCYVLELFDKDYSNTIIDDKKYKCKKNSLLLVKPNQSRITKTSYGCHFIHIYFNDSELTEILDSLPTQIAITDIDKYLSVFSEIAKLSSDNEQNYYMIVSALYKLISYILSDRTITYVGSNDKEKIDYKILEAANYMDKHFNIDIKLEDIAEESKFSMYYFHKKFKDMFGITPREYLFNKRISHAKYLLLNTKHSISKIALLSGFNTQTYFNYQFKKAEKISPLAYRKSHIAKI